MRKTATFIFSVLILSALPSGIKIVYAIQCYSTAEFSTGESVTEPGSTCPAGLKPVPTSSQGSGIFALPNYTCNGSCPQTTYTPLEPLPGAGNIDYGNFASYVNFLIPVLIIVGSLLGVGSLTINGVIYMTSAVVGEKSRALAHIQSSVWGLILLLASVLILNTINPQLTDLTI